MPSSMLIFIVLTVAMILKSAVICLSLPQDAKRNLEFEFLKKIEIERMKAQIYQELGLEETPALTKPPTKLPIQVIQLLLSENAPLSRPQNNLARILFSPTNQNLQCLRYKEGSCRRFEFNIPPHMIYTTSEFWMYRKQFLPSENHTISALCSHRGEETEHLIEHDELLEDDGKEKWLTFHLPMLQQLELWTRNVSCAIEVTGTVIDDKQNLPFLKITQDLEVLTRNRRSEDNEEEIEACRPIPFTVSFKEIGFEKHFSYPDSFNAKVCKGYCLKSPNFYETVMDLAFTGNTTLEQEYGRCWATCCRPKEFEPMDVIFRSEIEGGEVHNVTTLTDIIAKTCICR